MYLAKIGVVKPIWSRPLPSTPSSVTVIKDSAERYFLSFVVEVEPENIEAKSPSIGVDLGIKTFAACSDETNEPKGSVASVCDSLRGEAIASRITCL